MKTVGLTHGGFYKHFATKDDLFLESLGFAFEEAAVQFEDAAAAAKPGEEVAAIINSYLRLEHVKHPEYGCAIATLGTDVARQQLQTQKAAQRTIRDFIERMTRLMPGKSGSDREENFYLLFSSLVGAVTMARMIVDARTRTRILEANRKLLTESFVSPTRIAFRRPIPQRQRNEKIHVARQTAPCDPIVASRANKRVF